MRREYVFVINVHFREEKSPKNMINISEELRLAVQGVKVLHTDKSFSVCVSKQ